MHICEHIAPFFVLFCFSRFCFFQQIKRVCISQVAAALSHLVTRYFKKASKWYRLTTVLYLVGVVAVVEEEIIVK